MRTYYFIRSSSSNGKNAKVRIRMRLRDGRNVDFYGKTRETIHANHWSNERRNIKLRVEFKGKEELSKLLRDIKAYVEDKYKAETDKEILDKKTWLSQTIDSFYNPEKYADDKPKTLFEFIQNFIDKSPTRIKPKTGKKIGYKQRREYARTFYYLKKFCELKGREYNWQDIDQDFYQDFIEYLKSEKESEHEPGKKVPGLATNTIGKKIQTLKIMLNDAYSKDYPVNKAYRSKRFSSISEESDSIYLNENDLQQLYNLDLSKKPRLEKVRDLFLVGCWTGCRFGDLPKINPYNIHDGRIHLIQAKTDKKVIIPLHEVVKQILEKYDYELPKVITNQKFNQYIKEAAEEAGIKESVFKRITKGGIEQDTKYQKWELITTHTARRSFATNLYKSGFASQSIMQITGHKTETSFLKYIKVQPEEHAKMLELHWKNNTRLTVVK